jgi:hypothetical protein
MKCVLTKAGEPNEIAHIYPYSMRNENDRNEDNPNRRPRPSLWDILRVFWSEDCVRARYSAIFRTGTEACYNLMCLSPDAHTYYGRAYFVLKPIRLSDDKERLNI